MSRKVSWFSCGAASAVATKLALQAYPDLEIFYCEVKEEHPSNKIFLAECEAWFGKRIKILRDEDFDSSAKNVFRKTRYLVGPSGARCTAELKRKLRWEVSKPDDIHILGYTTEEIKRLERIQASEPLVNFHPILIERGLTKQDCLRILERKNISLPKMYRLGYKNNNCVGCVKGQAGYWNKIRVDFPDVFQEMSLIERELNRTICKIEWRRGGKRFLKRIFLDELPPEAGNYALEQDIECGILCLQASDELS